MSRHRPLHRALVVATLVAAGVVTPQVQARGQAQGQPVHTSTPRAAEEPATPLAVQMTGMSPAVVPEKGALLIRGIVTNVSSEEWTEINVAPFLSAEPITDRDELARAAGLEGDAIVGNRLSDPATYVQVGDLEPGESTVFAIRVPRDSMTITGEPGVYWIGVHALGSNADGRDEVADGRVRSFIPLVTREQARRKVDVALVLPMRERARRDDDGSLNGPARWEGLVSPEGRLTRLAEFAASAGTAQVTWALDPAVLDALEDFGRGNPRLSLGPAGRLAPGTSPSPSPSPSATEADPDESGAQAGQAADDPSDEAQARATTVLQTFLNAVRDDELLSMPYGDPDLASVIRNRPSLLSLAQQLSARSLTARGLGAVQAVAPPDALFDPTLLGGVDVDTLFLLGDGGRTTDQPYLRLPTGQPLVLTDDRASSGGPTTPGAAQPLALRQRILAEAALDLDELRPIVVRFPMRWEPGPFWRQADFFGGLSRKWIRLVPLTPGGPTTYDGELRYGKEQRKAELGPSNIAATRTLVRTANTLDDLLANANQVRDRLSGAALQASAYSARATPSLAAEQVRELDGTMRSRMNRVEVTGTDFVTLSGGSGTLTVTLVNGLDQPIDVGLQTRTNDPTVRVESSDPVQLGPRQRTTLRLSVKSGPGLHEVSMFPVTSDNQVIGTPFTFNVRTSQVGAVIWYVLAGGGVLLVVMILRRIVLRIRNRRWRLEDGA